MKHTKIKSFIAACMAAVTAVGCASLSAYAENEEFGGNHAIEDPDDYQRYLDSLTDEQRKIIADKEQMLEQLLADKDSTKISVTRLPPYDSYITLQGNFIMYKQETGSYCIPACIMSTLMFLGIGSPKQEVIDYFVHEHLTKVPEYVNSMQDQHLYTYKSSPSYDELIIRIKNDVEDCNVPTFLGIATTDINWYYRTSGHCVLSNGISEDKSMIMIADPLGDDSSGVPLYYYRFSDNVSDVTRAICC